MAFEYNGFIHRDLEPQVRYDAEQIELLKQANVDINNKIDTLPLGGEKVSLTFPAGASEGTITADQLTTLQASDANYIEMVNDKELYYLNDSGHIEGYLTYSHVGIENSKATIKTLTITVSARSFVIVTTAVSTQSGSGNVYMHSLEFAGESSTANPYYLYFYSTFNTSITYDNINEYSTQIPFGVLCHIDASGQFIFDGIITNIQQGSPGKIVLNQPGIGISLMFKLNSDSVTEV